MGKIYVFDHPLIQHKVAMIRDKATGTKDFRELVEEIAMLMTFESTRDLELEDVEIETPICPTTVKMLKGLDVAIVPILRAGLGMVEGIQKIIPNAKVGHIGLYRDPETHEPHEYYCKMPERSWSQTRCSQPAEAQWRPLISSRKEAARTSHSCA